MVYTVLIISSERQERAILCSVIKEQLAYCTIEANSELEAKHHLAAEGKKPDIILFDISRIDQPYKQISTLKNTAAYVPIVVITKYGDYDTAQQSIRHGAQDFLIKPVSPDRMKVTFNNMVLLYKLIMASSNAKTIGNTIVFSLFDDNGNIRTIEDLEWIAIDHAIQYYNGCMSEVARGLGIGRSTLYRKLNARNNNGTKLPEEEELSLNYVA